MKLKARKIAIVGTADTSVHTAPYNDTSWQIWNIARNFGHGKRYDYWFEIHSFDVLQANRAIPQYFDFLKKAGKKVICGLPQADLPDATPYPLQQVMRALDTDYFTCTAAYMIAYAIYLHKLDIKAGGKGIEEIGLWGIDMMDSASGEYNHQRPCCEYYLGIAKGLGIKIFVAPQSPLCKAHGMYAFTDLKFSREMTERMKDLEQDVANQRKAREDADTALIRSDAMLVQIRDITRRWSL